MRLVGRCLLTTYIYSRRLQWTDGRTDRVIIGLKDIFAAHTFACFILKLANT